MQNRFDKYSDNDLVQLLRRERKTETATGANIIVLINEIDRRRFFMQTKSSLYKYLTANFQYSKDEAYLRIKAAKAYALEPSVERAVRSGQTCLTHMKDAWVAIISEGKRRKKAGEPKLTKPEQQCFIKQVIADRDPAKTIAKVFPKLRPERNEDKPIADGKRMITITIEEEEYEEYKRAKSLLSNKLPTANFSEVITECVKFTVKALTPKAPKTPPKTEPTTNQRGHISVNTERHLHQEAGGRCQWVDEKTGWRCDSNHQLETEHHLPIAKGGTDTFANLKLYCRAHNQYAAMKAGLQQYVFVGNENG